MIPATPELPGSRRRPPTLPRPTPVPRADGPSVTRWRKALATGTPAVRESVRREVSAVLGAGTPLCEPGPPDEHGRPRHSVTFLFEDPGAQEVLLFVNRLTDESRLDDSLMARLLGTDVWHLGYLMGTAWRASYSFLPVPEGLQAPWRGAEDQVDIRSALAGGVSDPHNPATCPARGGRVVSVAALPDAPTSPWPVRALASRPAPQWQEGPSGRRVALQPCGVPAGGEATAPVVVLFDGEVWWEQGVVPAVRAAVSDGVLAPLHLVLLDSGGTAKRWRELDGTGGIEDSLADDLLPWVARRTGAQLNPDRVATAGQSLGGLSALLCVLRRPDAVRAALAQSSSLWQPYPAEVLDELLGRDGAQALADTRIVLEVGEQEWVLTGPHDAFAARLEQSPADVRYRRFDGGHDYACWREGIVPGLVELFPAPPRR